MCVSLYCTTTTATTISVLYYILRMAGRAGAEKTKDRRKRRKSEEPSEDEDGMDVRRFGFQSWNDGTRLYRTSWQARPSTLSSSSFSFSPYSGCFPLVEAMSVLWCKSTQPNPHSLLLSSLLFTNSSTRHPYRAYTYRFVSISMSISLAVD